MNQLTTADQAVAAFMLVRGLQIQATSIEDRTVVFHFSNDGGMADKLLAEFYAGGMVPANTYIAAYRRTRDILFQAKRRHAGSTSQEVR